jgi:hypothetical protein
MLRLKAGLLYFAMAFGAGFILGLIRVPFLVPRLGERYAELAEMPVMLVVIVMAARHIVRRFAIGRDVAIRLQAGLLALAFMLAAELLLATLIQGRSIAQYTASRDPVSGSVYLLLLLLFACMPALLLLRTADTRG